MALYKYIALDAAGNELEGSLESDSSENVIFLLSSQGLQPLDIELAHSTSIKRKITHRDSLMFIKQLQVLLKAGIPLLNGLQNLEQSEQNSSFKTVIKDLVAKLNQGLTLSQSLAYHPTIFKPYVVELVNAGEATGRLEEVLDRIHTQLYFEHLTAQQIKSATRYPLIIICTTIIAMLILNIWVIPVFAKLYENFKADLPIPTQIILAVSTFTRNYWYIVLLFFGGVIYTIKKLLSIPKYVLWWDTKKLKLPIFGKIWQNSAMTKFARGFALAYKSGIPINSALLLVSKTVMNTYIEQRLLEMVLNVEKGMSLTSSAMQAAIFNPVMLQMLSVGENSGSLDDLMIKMADMYQDDIENDVKTIGQQLEPYLLIFLGIGILIMAAGVFLPIWKLAAVAIK